MVCGRTAGRTLKLDGKGADMRRNILGLSAIGLVLAMPLASCSKSEDAPPAAKAPSGPRIVVSASDTADWQNVSATITTVDEAQVLARIPGILTALSVREGDLVKQGQVIGRIVDTQLGYQAGAYGAQAAAAQAQAAQAQAELARVRFLHQNGVYAKARLEQVQAAAAAAQAQVRAAQAQQAAVGAVAGQGAVVAPASGRVLRADVPAGAPVAPGMAIAIITAGPTILRLEMPESLAGKVHAGSRVRAAGTGGEPLEGRVRKLYPAIAAGQVTADVDLPGIDNALIGRRLSAQVETGVRKALLVPAQYVSRRHGIDYVTVLARDGSAADAPVQVAASPETGKLEVLSGIVPGDTLVGPAAAKASAAVRP